MPTHLARTARQDDSIQKLLYVFLDARQRSELPCAQLCGGPLPSQAAQVACAASGTAGQAGAACNDWVTLRRAAAQAPAALAAAPAPGAAAAPALEASALPPTTAPVPALEPAVLTNPAAGSQLYLAPSSLPASDQPFWLDFGCISSSSDFPPYLSCAVPCQLAGILYSLSWVHLFFLRFSSVPELCCAVSASRNLVQPGLCGGAGLADTSA